MANKFKPEKIIRIYVMYILGVAIGLLNGFTHLQRVSERYKCKITNGDKAFCISMALTSWVDVSAIAIVEYQETFYSEEIEEK